MYYGRIILKIKKISKNIFCIKNAFKHSLICIFLLTLATGLLWSQPQTSNEIIWNGSSNKEWNKESNWTPNKIPAPTDNVIIRAAGSYTPVITGNVSLKINSLKIESGKLEINTASTLNINGNSEILGTLNNDGTINCSGNFKTEGTINNNGYINIGGDFKDTKGLTSGNITLNGLSNQVFTAKEGTTYKDININKTSGTVYFNSNNFNITNFTINNNFSTIFNIPVTITNFIDNSVSGDITFNKGGTIKNNATFKTKGIITIDGSINKFNGGNITIQNGKTVLKTSIASSSKDLIFGNLITGETILSGNLKANSVSFGNNSKGISLSGSIETTGTQDYHGPVTINDETFFNTVSTITFDKKITEQKGQNINSNLFIGKNGSMPQNLIFSGDLDVNQISVKASNMTLPQNVITKGNQEYDILSSIDLYTNTTLSGKDISLKDNINSNYSLTIDNSGTLNFFNKPSIDATPTKASLLSFTQKNDGKVNLSANIKTKDGITFNSQVTLIDNVSLEGKNIDFINTISGTKSLSVKSSGKVSFSNNVGIIDSINVKAATSITLPLSVTTTGLQIFDAPQLILNSGITTIKGSNITLNDNITGINSSLYVEIDNSFTFDDKTGQADKKNTIAQVKDFIQINSGSGPWNVNISGDIKAVNKVSFQSPVTLTGNTFITGSEIDFEKPINGNYSLEIGSKTAPETATASLKNIGDKSKLSDLKITSKSINIDQLVTTQGNQIYDGDVILNNTKISTDKKSADITFLGNLGDGTSPITFNVPLGNIKVDGKVNLISLLDTNTNNCNITFNKGGVITNSPNLYTEGTVTFCTTENNDFSITQNNGTFTHIKGTTELSGNGNFILPNLKLGETYINGNISAKEIILGEPVTTTSNPKEIVIGGNITSSENQIYKGDVMLCATTTINTLSPKNITFQQKINGTQNLEIGTSGTEKPLKVVFTGNIGESRTVSNISVLSSNIIFPKSSTSQNGIIKTLENQSYNAESELSLSGNTVITGKNISLFDNIKGVLYTLTINNQGTLSLYDRTNKTDMAQTFVNISSFVQAGNGNVSISGDIKTTENINFNSDIFISGNVVLNGKNIIFNNSITPESQNPEYGIQIISSESTTLPALVKTTGSQLYETGTKLLLAKNTKLIGKDISLYNKISGPSFSLTINHSDTLTLREKNLPTDINFSTDLYSFTEEGTSQNAQFLIEGNMTSQEIISFNNAPITLNDDILLKSKTVFISDKSPISGQEDHNLIITSSGNNNKITLNSEIKNILSLTATSSSININNNIQTKMNQDYKGPVMILNTGKTITTESLNNNITFYDKVGTNTSNLNVKAAGDIIFKEVVNLKTLSDIGNTGSITLEKGGSIETDTIFNTSKLVKINDSSSSLNVKNNKLLKHISGPTVINGTITAGSVELGNNNSSSLGNLGTITLSCKIKTSGNQTYKGPVELNGQTELKIQTTQPSINTAIVEFSPSSSLDLKDSNLTLKAHCLFSGSNIDTNQTSPSPSPYINAENYDFVLKPLSVTSSVSNIKANIKAENIIIDNSVNNLILSSNLTAKNDIAIFGSEYSTKDQESKNPNIYIYPYTTSPAYTSFPTSKDTPVPSNAKTITIGKDITLETGKNLYINGTKITGSNQLTLKFPSNYNTLKNYATSYYSDFSSINCIITSEGISPKENGKLVIESCNLNTQKQNMATGWDYEDFTVKESHTIDDNVIFIQFDRKIRFLSESKNNKENGLKSNYGNRINHSGGNYSNTIFTSDDEKNFVPLNKNTDKIYITSPQTWNTDATSTSTGTGTDKRGNHKDIKPYLNIKRNDNNYLFFITDEYGKRLKQYSGNIIPVTTDLCNPVLVSVSLGQELHETEADKCQSYDAHNFIEFRYSEPVSFAAPQTNSYIKSKFEYSISDFKDVQNITSSEAKFGNINNNIIGITFDGLGKISEGKIITGTKNSSEDMSINTLYRKDNSSIRISIAGQTINDAKNEKNWVGFIDSRTIEPSGKITNTTENTVVKDAIGNVLIDKDFSQSSTDIQLLTLPPIILNNSDVKPAGCINDDYTYSSWDLSAPVFAQINIPKNQGIVTWEPNSANEFEIIGYSPAGSTNLQRLEFHLFDNIPTEEYVWYSSRGWYKDNIQQTACADISGGARPFLINSDGQPIKNKSTTGGIRFHTINNEAFSYTLLKGQSTTGSFKKVSDKISSTFFTGYTHGDKIQNNLGELYFSLELDKTDIYPIETQFTISYVPTEQTGYITDLAGNRLEEIDKTHSITTVDRTPPKFNILLSPLNQKDIFILFSKKLNTNLNSLTFTDSVTNLPIPIKGNSFEEAITYCFNIIEIDENGNVKTSTSPDMPQIDRNVKAKIGTIRTKTNNVLTAIKLTLDKNLTFDALTKYHIQLGPSLKEDGSPIKTSFDGMTGIQNSRVTLIRDDIGNFMEMYSANSISDFAINLLNPVYAHNPNRKNNGKGFMDGLYEEGSWAVHDWNENQQNYGTLYGNEAVQIVVNLNKDAINGTDNNSIGENISRPKGVAIYLDATPDKNSLSSELNSNLRRNYRIWLPETSPNNYLLEALAKTNNSQYNTVFSNENKDKKNPQSKFIFDISEEIAKNMDTNQQISFIFAISEDEITEDKPFSPLLIYNKLKPSQIEENKYLLDKSIKLPVYCLRLKDPSDITSIDLWSYKTKSVKEQRGGVTILNNVINAPNGEDTVIRVKVPSQGILSIIVTTIDGNVIKYLHRGNIEAGEYDFYWNGTNNNENIVARGLYFIRVVGAGLDETRKVMVVH